MTTDLPAVGVIGLGLIGGGIALDLARAGHAIVGSDRDPAVRDRARELDLEVVDGLDPLVDACDLVVVAVPLQAVPGVLAAVRDRRGDVLLTDVASVKDPAVLAPGGLRRWLGGHPMAGNERSGIDAARPGLFDGAVWYLTPTPDTAVGDLLDVLRFVRALAAEPVVVDARTHDRYVAMLSHVPHLLAYGLHASATDVMGDGVHALGGGSFRDATRVAASDPAFWSDVLHANRVAVREALSRLESWLDSGAQDLDETSRLEERLTEGRRRPAIRTSPAHGATVVRLPEREATLGVTTAKDLCDLGATGMRVVEVAESADGIELHLEPL